MVRLLLAIFSFVSLLGCSQKGGNARLEISTPAVPSSIKAQSLGVHSAGWGYSDPATISNFVCYGVLVTGPEDDMRRSSCKDSAGAEMFKVGRAVGLVPAGQTFIAEVPSGRARTIRIIAFNAANSSACVGIRANEFDKTKLSAPHVVSSITLDLQAGDQVLTMNLSLTGAQKFDDCTGPDFQNTQPTSPTPTPPPNAVSVTSVYANAPGFTDWIKNDGTTLLNATGAVCVLGTDINCFPGGPLKMVDLPSETSCAGLSATDALNVFSWNCAMTNGHAVFYSEHFKPGKGLKDLVSPAGAWISNSVIVNRGASVAYTTAPSNTWWNNPIELLPNNSGGSVQTLSTAGTIYVLDASRTTAGYNINAHKIAVVVPSGLTLSYDGSATNNCSSLTGQVASASNRCVLAAGSKFFLWVEGAFYSYDATNSAHWGFYGYSVNQSVFRNIDVKKSASDGIKLGTSGYNRLSNIGASFNTLSGIYLEQSSNNQLRDLVLARNGDGLTLNSSSLNNVIARASAFSNTAYGIDVLGGSSGNILVQISAGNNTYKGIYIGGMTNTLVAATAINQPNNYPGVEVTGAGHTIQSILSLNNGYGIQFSGATSVAAAQVASGHNSNYAITNVSVSSVTFTGLVKSQGTCYASGSTGIDSGCNPTSGIGVTGSSMLGSIFGKVTSDISNTHSNGGPILGAAITDWVRFDNIFRGWGLDGSAFPHSSNQDICPAGVLCRIWDVSLLASDTSIRDNGNNGAGANGTFTAGANCPISGTDTVVDSSSRTFARQAMEIMDSGGNNNGLCESGEKCLYMPNLGAYQGHGDYKTPGTCSFSNATISGVQLYAHPINGY